MTTWIILRAAGIGAYLMLFFSVAFGLVATSAPFGKRIAKQSAILIHQFMSTVGLVLLGVHICGLLLDRYIHFGPTQVLVPGTSSYRPVAVAIGVVGMYSMVLVAVSSWLRKHYSAKVWRALHMAAVPAFVLSMLHGVFAGADSARPCSAGSPWVCDRCAALSRRLRVHPSRCPSRYRRQRYRWT